MSIQSLNSQIANLDREINSIQTQISNLDRNIITKSKEANTYLERISKEKNLTRLVSLQRDYNRKQEEIHRIENDRNSKEKTLADKKKRKAEYQQQLLKEEKSEREKTRQENVELLRLQERITREVEQQRSISRFIPKPAIEEYYHQPSKKYDVFISHASEDKEAFVRPLVKILTEMGVEVWFDEAQIKLGHSIRKSIDTGLANSKYGLIVLSKPYMTKYWTEQEFNGLFAKKLNNSILPIWHKVTVDEIKVFSHMLIDIMALNTAIHSTEDIAKQVADLVLKQPA